MGEGTTVTRGSRRECALAAVRGQQTATVPFHLVIDSDVRESLECEGVDVQGYLDRNYIDWISLDDPSRREISEELFLDGFGVPWQRASSGGVRHPSGPSRSIDPDSPVMPDPHDARRFVSLREHLALGRDALQLVMWRGPWEVAGFILGLENLLADLISAPARVARLLDAICEYQLALVDEVATTGVDAIMIGDDYGQQNGLLISREMWRAFPGRRLQRLVERVHGHSLPFVLHCDGDVSEIAGDLVDMQVDMLHPIQPECMDVFALKQRWGDHLALYGGVSSQHLLVHGSPAQVRSHVQETLRVLAEHGGYIFAPSFMIISGTPTANARVFLEMLDEIDG